MNLEFTFIRDAEPSKEIKGLLLSDETIEYSCTTFRDTAVFTNKRIIISDKQGITGKKIECYTIPYKSIIMYSSENSGKFLDFTSEMEIWTRIGKVKIHMKKNIDVRKIDRIIASHIL